MSGGILYGGVIFLGLVVCVDRIVCLVRHMMFPVWVRMTYASGSFLDNGSWGSCEFEGVSNLTDLNVLYDVCGFLESGVI